MKTKRVIDRRVKEKFMLDDAYLNGQARICGWQASLVYLSLCRHVNINQESFPSISLMTEELSVNRKTIMKGLQQLEKYGVIEIVKRRSKTGKWLNNTYILLDKSVWKKEVDQVPVEDTAPSPSQGQSKSLSGTIQVPVEDTKETHRRKHIEGTVTKVTEAKLDEPAQFGNEAINNLMEMFEEIMQFKSAGTKDRWFAKHLLNNFTLEQLRTMMVYCSTDQYAPRIGSITKLWYKRGDVIAGLKSMKNKFLEHKIVKL